ncbi:hypothetical protein AAL_06170 [Moelleriella libera RCEF 2490]|uniref:Uncharacterized protein n=1 Tax=Moelleriella libera RCEF 2490 TaxID=1081109 RepID=A0A167ZE91_9HYPO|nr:hypothetical protein AAL_06170 [Moelleriella libera RCEF 2490]
MAAPQYRGLSAQKELVGVIVFNVPSEGPGAVTGYTCACHDTRRSNTPGLPEPRSWTSLCRFLGAPVCNCRMQPRRLQAKRRTQGPG